MPESLFNKVVGLLQPATLLKERLVDCSKKVKIAFSQKAYGCLLLEVPVFIETFEFSVSSAVETEPRINPQKCSYTLFW